MMSTMVKAQLQLQMISARVTMILLMVKLAAIVIAQTAARNGANVNGNNIRFDEMFSLGRPV